MILEENNSILCPSCQAKNRSTNRFCEECGASLATPKLKVCQYCLESIPLTASFCPLCGKETKNTASTTEKGVPKKSKAKRVRFVIDLIVLSVVVALASVFAYNVIKNEAQNKYKEEVTSYMKQCDDAIANIDDISQTIEREWYGAIYEGEHGGDSSAAIDYACSLKNYELSKASETDVRLFDAYKKLRKIPFFANDDEMRQIRDAATELHNCYSDYYIFLADFYCTYADFSNTTADLSKDCTSKYNALKNLL